MRVKSAHAPQKGDQDAPGALNQIQIGRFATLRQTIEELDIQKIQPHQIIPDYKDPTASLHPIVIKTPTSSYCIDGWPLIEQARQQNKLSISCHIFHIPLHSDTEIAIRKVAIRTMPQGGRRELKRHLKEQCSWRSRMQPISKLMMILQQQNNPKNG